jgi:hypothetical protein
VCPASRLVELPDMERGVSVVLDTLVTELDPRVASVEAPPGVDVGSLVGLAEEIYVEVPLDDDLEARLGEVDRHGLRAKVRCAAGPAQLGWFLRECRTRGIAYKATAGLHRAVRTDAEHGFLNLLAAAVFGDEDALEEREPRAFELHTEGFRWRARTATAQEVAQARNARLRAIGSCSFFEPVEELENLGMLPL